MNYQSSPTFETDLAALLDGKAKPKGALGQLERLAAKVARWQGRLDPVLDRACLIVFAGDHGIAREAVSAYPPEATRQMVLATASGGAAINVLSRQAGMELVIVNSGVKGGPFNLHNVLEEAVGEGTGNALMERAMGPDDVYRAIRVGRRIGAEGDFHAAGFGDMGIGNTSAATLVAHRLTGARISDLVGRGTGLDSAGLLRKADILERAAARVTEALTPERALSEYGGFEIAMMTGAMIGAAEAGRIVLVDGFIASVAALAAAQMQPDIREAMIFSHRSREPGHRYILEAMGARTVLDLDMALGEGSGAALAWPIVKSAVAVLNHMATAQEAGLSPRV